MYRPGAVPGLNPATLQYSVEQPSTAPALGQPLAVTVMRKGSTVPLFDTTGNRFIFKDQFIEFTTNIAEDADLYGMGEMTLPTGLLLPRNGRTLTLWSRDIPCAFPDVNLYGSHPFYLQVNRGMVHTDAEPPYTRVGL